MAGDEGEKRGGTRKWRRDGLKGGREREKVREQRVVWESNVGGGRVKGKVGE